VITPEELGELEELQQLLDKAHLHYFENSEGYCKSSEGAVTIGFGTYFDRRDGDKSIKHVEIYSYLFGEEGRLYNFSSVRTALEKVRTWHKREMSRVYDETGYVISEGEGN
jgi:hypothetical protein